jgi:hypothetical protein
MQGLDEQVQEVKSDVLAIAAELRQLEEKLLFPSNTQLAIFVSLAEEDAIEIDSVKIEIDGEPVARHVYSFKELEALRKGGVQRIYTGNVPTGKHQIDVSMMGSLPGGAPFEEAASFPFEKDVEPKVVGLSNPIHGSVRRSTTLIRKNGSRHSSASIARLLSTTA